MGHMITGFHMGHRVRPHRNRWIQFLLTTPAVVCYGWPFLVRGVNSVADIASAYFLPPALIVAWLTFALWAVFGPGPSLAHALVNAVAVLIIASAAMSLNSVSAVAHALRLRLV